ncbi:MAG: hypothetical protein KGJ56_06495, partial [Gammaproteobacteria bacterium]|nr:hypothetical protein [Gammaproteobacteria bacterium]
MADKKEQIEKTEKAVNNFLALVGYASWVCSTIEEKLNESIKVALGTDLNRTMIVLPRSDIRKKIDILRKLLKERDYPKTKLSRAIRV